MCPQPVRACPGTFSEEAKEKLANDVDRARWMDHRCELCGQFVSAQVVKGSWVPDSHWPSVRIQRKPRYVPIAKRQSIDSEAS